MWHQTRVVNAQSIGEVGEFNRGKFKNLKLTAEDEAHYDQFPFIADDHLQHELVTALRRQDAVAAANGGVLPASNGGAGDAAPGSMDCCTIL
jgi:hypothetical protein